MKEKKSSVSKKINVLFLVNELFINNFVSVYESIKKSSVFSVIVVTCSSLSTEYKDEISSSEIYDYLKENKIECIDGYDYSNNCYIDLVQYNPDYIFVSTPYDIYRPLEYSSSNLSKIAKLCTIEYGAIIINDIKNVLLENKFYHNCYFSFINNEKELECSNIINDDEFQKIKYKFIPVGCVKLDKYLFGQYKNNHWEQLFNDYKLKRLRIVWKPRWTIKSKNDFFENLKKFVNYCVKHKNEVELLLLEHPLLRTNLKSKNLLIKYEKIINKLPDNFCVYNKSDFLDYVLESDVLVGENTSLMSEFSITNKPIIYIGDYSELNSFGRQLIERKNVVTKFNQITELIDNLEHKKINKYYNTKLFSYKNMSSADYLLEILKKDYEKNNYYYRNILLDYSKEIQKLKTILIQGYYEDILNKDIDDFEIIANSLKMWSDEIMKNKSNEKNKQK